MSEQQTEPEKTEAEGREVFVTKDESGVTSLSEDKEGADPSVITDDGSDEDADDSDDADEGDSASDADG